MKEITEEEQAILLQNEYIQGVTSRFVYFSAEFKELFYKEYQAGKKPMKILKEYGIDTKILGQGRVNALRYHILRDLKRGRGFTEMKGEESAAKRARSLSPEAKIRRLEHELAYTKQELEFVKKIIAAGREGGK